MFTRDASVTQLLHNYWRIHKEAGIKTKEQKSALDGQDSSLNFSDWTFLLFQNQVLLFLGRHFTLQLRSPPHSENLKDCPHLKICLQSPERKKFSIVEEKAFYLFICDGRRKNTKLLFAVLAKGSSFHVNVFEGSCELSWTASSVGGFSSPPGFWCT